MFSFSPWSHFHPTLALLQWFAFLPLLIALNKQEYTRKQTFIAGFIVSLGITVGGFYWIIYATQQYGGLPFIAALGVFAAFCIIAQLQVPIYLLIRKNALKHFSTWKWIAASGLIYSGIESFYPKLFLDTAGHAFADSIYFSQIADIGGVFFITTMVVTFAESLAYAITNKNAHKKLFITPIMLIVLSLSYGILRVRQITPQLEAQKQNPALIVGVVQANIGDYLKIAAEKGMSNASDQVISEYLKYSSLAIEQSIKSNTATPDAIVWPETAYSSLFGNPQRYDEQRMEERLREFSRNFAGTMIFGGYDQDSHAYDYNALFFLSSKDASTTQRPPVYHKNILLMFGETLPFAEQFPSIKSWFPTMGFFGRGPGPEVYPVTNKNGNVFKMAPSICYEGLFPYFSFEGSQKGADALLNVTNDSWFGPDGEPYLHFALTRFRTIETRLPMIRSTNTGFSALIDPLGRITTITRLFEPSAMTATVYPRLPLKSPYMTVAALLGGQWFERLSQMCVLILSVVLYRKRRLN